MVFIKIKFTGNTLLTTLNLSILGVHSEDPPNASCLNGLIHLFPLANIGGGVGDYTTNQRQYQSRQRSKDPRVNKHIDVMYRRRRT